MQDYMNTPMIHPRTMAAEMIEISRSFPCVLVTGARQVGKSTLLRSLMPVEMRYISLDDYRLAREAQNDPIGFLETYDVPLCIDEVQYAPELLRAIKLRVDAEPGRKGMYWLTGSQRFHLMQGVSESLAGRIGILDLYSFSQAEMVGRAESAPAFSCEPAAMRDAVNRGHICNITELYERIWLGGYPARVCDSATRAETFFNAYLQTYLERDVQALQQVGDRGAFLALMKSAAARTGQQLVYSDIARDADVSVNTAKKWISILETSGIIHLLQPYHTNTSKRLTKSPKLYFMDTGFCAWMGGWSSPEVLMNGALSGAILETWVYGQLYRSFVNRGIMPRLSYFRNSNGAEVDFLIEKDGCIYPLEVKRSSSPSLSDLKGVQSIPPGKAEIKPGVVLCTAMELLPLGKGNVAFPISAL